MEYLIKDLMARLSERKSNEIILMGRYKKENMNDLILISSGKIMELDKMIHDLEEMVRYHSKCKS